MTSSEPTSRSPNIITKLYHHFFTFTGSSMYVEYGDPSIPSHSWWIVPGTWEYE